MTSVTEPARRLPALITDSGRVAQLAGRQDSVTEQMFDVVAIANVYGYRDAAVYLAVLFLSVPEGHLHSTAVAVRDEAEILLQLRALHELLRPAGAQDASRWLGEHIRHLSAKAA